jgi:DNA-binding GntR family transcriptional regulator
MPKAKAKDRKSREGRGKGSPKTPANSPGGKPVAEIGLLHASVYSDLRLRFITGRVTPGSTLSTRGLAEELGVSQMPVREALGRLAAEGAVEIHSKRKIRVPPVTADRFDDLLRCRLLLEPEAALESLPYIDSRRLRRLKSTDKDMGVALRSGDVQSYMQGNFDFHFLLYRAQPRRTLVRLIETLWLQFGPYMRVVYGRFGTANLVDQHQVAIACIEAGDAAGLGRAISMDISDGMGLVGQSGFEDD